MIVAGAYAAGGIVATGFDALARDIEYSLSQMRLRTIQGKVTSLL